MQDRRAALPEPELTRTASARCSRTGAPPAASVRVGRVRYMAMQRLCKAILLSTMADCMPPSTGAKIEF